MAFSFDAAVSRRYEDLLVPRLFGPWAHVLVERMALRDGEAVLDVACGTGAVAREAARKVGPRGRVTAADESESMVSVAASLPARPGEATVAWTVSPAAPLAVPDARFDACACQQGLQLFPDRPAALAEMRRALKPGGRLAVAVWAEPSPPFPGLIEVLRETEPELAARANAPWSWTDGAALGQSVRAAGFRDVSLEVRDLEYRWEGGADQAVQGVSATPIGPLLAGLPRPRRETVLELWRACLSDATQDGAVSAVSRAHLVTAIR